MAVKEKPMDSAEEFDWNVDNEIQLFLAMNGHKPTGVNKYFHMVCIWEKFRNAIHKEVSLKAIWNHLKEMYDLNALDDMEDVPFPNSEKDFSLPENEYSELIRTRKKEESESKPKEIKEKVKEIKKEKETKEPVKKEIVLRDSKVVKEVEKKKEEPKKVVKEPDIKKDNKRESKEVKKEQKVVKGRPKGRDESEEAGTPVKKERKDSESSRESLKRAPKRPTRQSIDSSSKSSSPRDTPPPKRRRI